MVLVEHLKTFVKERPRLYDLALRGLRMTGRKTSTYDLLREFARRTGGVVNFVQIGANDGLRSDPIREFVVRYGWRGVMVEPMPFAFDALRRNYAGYPRLDLVFLNAAVSEVREEKVFWTIDVAQLGHLSEEDRLSLSRKSSFDRELLESFLPPDLDVDLALAPLKLDCLTFEDVVAAMPGSARPELLVVDAEGYDGVIIRSNDFSRFRPQVVIFEHGHLGDTYAAVHQHLLDAGYRMYRVRGNTIAAVEELSLDWLDSRVPYGDTPAT